MNLIKLILIILICLNKTIKSQVFYTYKIIDGKYKNFLFIKEGSQWYNKSFKLYFEEIKTSDPNEIIIRNSEEHLLFKFTKGALYYNSDTDDYLNAEFIYSGSGDFGTTFPENISVSKKEIRYGESIELIPDSLSFLEPDDKWIWTTENCANLPCKIIQNDLVLKIKPQQTTTYIFSSEKYFKKNIFIPVKIIVDTLTISPKEIIIPDKICHGEKITLKIIDGSLGKNCQWAWYDNQKMQHPLIVGTSSINILANENKTYYVTAIKNGKIESKIISKAINIQTKSTVTKLKSMPDLCVKYGLLIDLSNQKLGNGSEWHLTVDNPIDPVYKKTTTSDNFKLNSNDLLEFTKGKQKIILNLQSKGDCFQSEIISTSINLLDAGFYLNKLNLIANYDLQSSKLTLTPKIDDEFLSHYTNKGVKLTYQWFKKNKIKNKIIKESTGTLEIKVKKTTTFVLKVYSSCGVFETNYTFYK